MADSTTSTVSGGSLISQIAGDLLLTQAPASEQTVQPIPKDSSWVKQSFLVTTDKSGTPMLSQAQRFNRDFTTADISFTDSSIGGNICINPLPQYTRYADIRRPGLHMNGSVTAPLTADYTPPSSVEIGMAKNVSYGQGSYYHEAFDKNNQIIHMRFGVAEFNSLTQFLTGFYDSGAASVAREGRLTPSLAKSFLTLVGNSIGIAIAPLFILPMAIMMLGVAARYFLNQSPSKFYYLKPAMPVYWTTVTNMVNQIGTNMGLISYIDTRQSGTMLSGSKESGFTPGTTSQSGYGSQLPGSIPGVIANYLPDNLIRPDGLIDVKKIACRAKFLEAKYHSIVAEVMGSANASNTDFTTLMGQALTQMRGQLTTQADGDSLESYLLRHLNSVQIGQGTDTQPVQGSLATAASSGAASATTNPQAATAASSSAQPGSGQETDLRTAAVAAAQGDNQTFLSNVSAFADEVMNYFIANLADGSEWASFRVDYTGPQSESFGSSTAESALANKINSMSSASRSARFSVADGNVIPGMDKLVGGLTDIISGAAEVLHVDGIAALAGSCFVDIPKHWESSYAQLPKANYTMTLISPYGNPVSQMFNIWIPVCMLISGALPLSTGKQSYTSPFLCELHDRGRMMTRLGLIDNITVTRGTSNLGFNQQGHALAVEVSFSVTDLSTIMAIPAMPSFNVLNPLAGIFDSDNVFSDYLMTLASLPLPDVVYRFPMLKYQINKRIADYKLALSPANIGANLASLPGINMLGAFMRGARFQ